MGWIIASAFLLLILALLISPLRIYLNIDKSVCVKISYLCFNIFTFDSDKDNNSQAKSKASVVGNTEKKQDNKIISLLKDYSKAKDKKELLLELFEFVKLICFRLKKTVGRIYFKKIKFDLTVATTDAADTAILYGRVCSVLGPIVCILENAKNFDIQSVKVQTDFTKEETSFVFSTDISIKIIHILAFVLSSALGIIKNKVGDLKNGRK